MTRALFVLLLSVISYLVEGAKKIELGMGLPRNLEKCLSVWGIFLASFSQIVEK